MAYPDLQYFYDSSSFPGTGSDADVEPDFPILIRLYKDACIYSRDIYFSNEHPTVNEEIGIAIKFHIVDFKTILGTNSVEAKVRTFLPGAPKTIVYEDRIELLHFFINNFSFKWKPEASATYIVEVELGQIDPEDSVVNNIATRAITVDKITDATGSVSANVRKKQGDLAGVTVQLLNSNGIIASTTNKTKAPGP